MCENYATIDHHITSAINSTTKRQVEVGSLSQLWSFFLLATQKSSHTATALESLHRILQLLSQQFDLTTVICSSLEIALGLQRSNKDQSIHLLFNKLVPKNTQTSQEKSHCLHTASALTFTAAILSGWKLLGLSENSSSVQFAREQLNSYFLHQELNLKLPFALKQVLLSGYLSSEVRKSSETSLNTSSFFSTERSNKSM